MQERARLVAVEFVAQAGDVDIHGVVEGRRPRVLPPDFASQHLPRDHRALRAQEADEDIVLAGCEVEDLLRARDAASEGIYLQVAQAEAAGRAGLAPAVERAHAGQEFGEGVGFDQIIVGPEVEAAQALFEFAAGGRHNDGKGGLGLAQEGEEREAIAVGQPEVEHDQVGDLVGQLAAGGGEGGDVADEAVVFAEALLQAGREVGIIFH